MDSPALPKPVQRPGPPIIVGGSGPKRTPRLAATYADEFNALFAPPDQLAAAYRRVAIACEKVDRDPATIVRSVVAVTCVGSDHADYERRAAAAGRDPDELRRSGVTGSPAEAAEKLAAYAAGGAQRIYLQLPDIADPNHLDVILAALTR